MNGTTTADDQRRQDVSEGQLAHHSHLLPWSRPSSSRGRLQRRRSRAGLVKVRFCDTWEVDGPRSAAAPPAFGRNAERLGAGPDRYAMLGRRGSAGCWAGTGRQPAGRPGQGADRQLRVALAVWWERPKSRPGEPLRRARRGHWTLKAAGHSGVPRKWRSAVRGCAAAGSLEAGRPPPGRDLVVSVTSSVPPPVRPAGARRRASRRGYWVGGGLGAAVCIGAAAWVVLAFLGQMNPVNWDKPSERAACSGADGRGAAGRQVVTWR